jgi:WD40 repeat protein/tRNA A-37 threonylcarbamoyl transferase component Bud32
MNAELAARLDAVCDTFEQAWRSGADPDIGSFVASQVEHDLRSMVLPHLLAVDAEYRRARDGAAPSLAEYAALLSIDPGELQQMSKDVTWMTGHAQTPVVGDLHIAAGKEHDGVAIRLDGRTKMPQIDGYEILSELGRGGMGVVYKARQIRAGRLVALKTIHAPHLAGSEQIKRFQGEAAAAARLNHRGIVPVYDVGECNGLHYFSMGFVDGPNLEMKAREQILSCREAANICKDLAEALEYAHQNGVIHRDVKPHNVLIGPDGKPRLMDFGLAKLIDGNQDLTSTGQVMGTAAYMAPEQARGIRTVVEPTIDVYSLGATLYRCVTGRPPFQASTTIEVLRQLNEDEPVSPRRLNREVDAEIETLCLKCLDKEPTRRFQSAGELAAELNRYLNREPIQSRPISAVSRAWRWCLRRPASAAAIFLGVTLLTLMAAGIPLFLLQQNKLQLAALQQQRDVDARGKAESARQAEEQARKQAETLAAANAARAATQEYFVSIMKVREMRMQPEPEAGWTWEALDLLEKAAASNADGKDPVAVRSLIADTLVTPDIREIGRIEGVPNTHGIAMSHDGKLLAAGDYGGNPSQVRIYRINTTRDDSNRASVSFELFRECSVDTTWDGVRSELTDRGLWYGKINSEGMWALDFSPDDKQIAVGTRNGNITIWQIDCDPPRILFDKRFPEIRTRRLAYSPDGRRIFATYDDPVAFREFGVSDQSNSVVLFEDYVDFSMSHDGKAIVSSDGRISRLSSLSGNGAVQFEHPGARHRVVTDRSRPLAIVGTVPSSILNTITGESTFDLQYSAAELNAPYELTFAADTSIAIGTMEPQNLRLWDAISGKKAIEISYPGSERPNICAGPEHDRVYVYSTVNMFANQLRCAAPLQAHAEPATSLSEAAAPFSAIVPGSQVLSCFALSADQQSMAVVEAAPFDGLQTIPDGYRARLRKLNTSDGRETDRWTCLLLSSGENRNTLTDGDAVTFPGDDHRIAFTTPALGNVAIASDAGFHFLSGAGIDVDQQPPVVTSAKAVNWSGGKVPAVSETAGFRPAISLKLPRSLTQSKERLLLRLIAGETIRQYEVSDRHLDSAGWYLMSLDQFSEDMESGTWRVEATLVESDLHFDSMTGNNVGDHASGIETGPLFLLPWKRVNRGNTPPVYPLRLGPLARHGDKGLAAVIESFTLHHLSSNPPESTPVPWRDADNYEEDIRGVSVSRNGHFVGTDSGLAALVKPDGSQELIERAHTEKGAYDSRDGVLATAVADSVDLAVVGTLRGQIKVYDLIERTGAPTFVTNAHSREIVALAFTDDGQLLASADAEGALRFWKRHADRLELLFEMTADKSPIQSMQFSRDGDLYLLRQGHRGVLKLELDELAAHFRNCELAFGGSDFPSK